MTTLEQLAQAALERDGLQVRSLAQDLLRETPRLTDLLRPVQTDARLLCTAAALAELLADRHQQAPPTWTGEVGPLPEPFYMLEAAQSMKRLRALCETQSPEPLRKRRLYAPPNFLAFA